MNLYSFLLYWCFMMNSYFKEDMQNIKMHLYSNLKPYNKKSLKRQFKVNISQRLFVHLKTEHDLTGRFKDAGYLIEDLELPDERLIESGKSTRIGALQARVSRGKSDGDYIGKPWIIFRFIRINDF
jgi:hypothetical protein